MASALLFVDNSNIFISAKDEALRREGRPAKDQVRLQFDHLIELALGGRPLGRAFVVGSIPPEQRAVWDRLKAATGIEPELYERGQFTGGEQGLDAEDWLVIPLMDQLVAAGRVLQPGECYSYVQLPLLGGDYTPENTRIASIADHYAAIGPIHEKLKDTPDGTRIRIKTAG